MFILKIEYLFFIFILFFAYLHPCFSKDFNLSFVQSADQKIPGLIWKNTSPSLPIEIREQLNGSFEVWTKLKGQYSFTKNSLVNLSEQVKRKIPLAEDGIFEIEANILSENTETILLAIDESGHVTQEIIQLRFPHFQEFYKDLTTKKQNLISLGVTSLFLPLGATRTLLTSGYEVDTWFHFSLLTKINDALFSHTSVPIWNQLHISLGLFLNELQGPDFNRKYMTMGFAPGVEHQFKLDHLGHHTLHSQVDFRLGYAYASKTGSSSHSPIFEPTIFSGYLYHSQQWMFGCLAEFLMATDSSLVTALGLQLRIGYTF